MTNSRHLGQTDRGEKNGDATTTAQIENRMHGQEGGGEDENEYMDNKQ